MSADGDGARASSAHRGGAFPGGSAHPRGEGPKVTARVLVTGGAGFVGSHLCERLLEEGHEVLCVDNLVTGSLTNVAHLLGRPGFRLLQHDVREPLPPVGRVRAVLHLASPASPVGYHAHPIETLETGSVGTGNALRVAADARATFLLASTSEIYGDPEVHPQTEGYRGNVSPTGPRSMYAEAKRFAEALVTAHHRAHGVDVRIVRIFNTYGPRMAEGDGRVVPAFVTQALDGLPLTVHGDGSQTRSFCYVDDLVDGILAAWRLGDAEPVNLGNPQEVTMLQLAELVRDLVGSDSSVAFQPRPEDDPAVRRPDVARAERLLGWRPAVPLEEGLRRTIAWFRDAKRVEAAPAGATGRDR